MLIFIIFNDFLYDKISSVEGCVCVRGRRTKSFRYVTDWGGKGTPCYEGEGRASKYYHKVCYVTVE